MTTPQRVYKKHSRTGGGTALDGIDGAGLNDQDLALVIEDDAVYIYWLDDDSAASENDPFVISPDSNAGDKRWILTNMTGQNQVNLLSNTGFGVWSNSTLENVGSAIVDDDCADDDTGDWTTNGVLAFDTDHYEFTSNDAGDLCRITASLAATLTNGKLYQVSVDIKDGTKASGIVRIGMCTAGILFTDNHYVTATTAAGWATHTCTFEAVETDTYLIIYTETDWDANIEFKNVTLYEVTPGCVAADALGPDGWSKDTSGLEVWREPNGSNTKAGEFYALKLTSSNTNRTLQWPTTAIYALAEHRQRFDSRTVTFGAWVKTSEASSAILKILDGTTTTSSSYHTGGGGWEWLEVTAAIGASPSSFRVYLRCEANPSTVYYSQPMLVFGSSIGEGNYVPPQDKVIRFEKNVLLTDYDNSPGGIASDLDAEINLEAQSDGKIPKNVSEIYVSVRAKDSAAGANIGVWMGPDTTYCAQHIGDIGLYLEGLGNDVPGQTSGWVRCDSGGDLWLFINMSGSATLDCEIKVSGVKLR